MAGIQRFGDSPRWSDVVVHRGVARWVEVADDLSCGTAGQVTQILAQTDATLAQLGATRDSLLQVLIFLADLTDSTELNRQWDAWIPTGQAPVRACVGAALAARCQVEMVVTAAIPADE
jgi:enamine deaminase RidA (YjgF/YER057c/UK114 family)